MSFQVIIASLTTLDIIISHLFICYTKFFSLFCVFHSTAAKQSAVSDVMDGSVMNKHQREGSLSKLLYKLYIIYIYLNVFNFGAWVSKHTAVLYLSCLSSFTHIVPDLFLKGSCVFIKCLIQRQQKRPNWTIFDIWVFWICRLDFWCRNSRFIK